MSRVRRAITAFFLFSSVNVIFYFLENVCLSNPPPFSPNPVCVCVGVCVCGWEWVGGQVDVQARVVYVSE